MQTFHSFAELAQQPTIRPIDEVGSYRDLTRVQLELGAEVALTDNHAPTPMVYRQELRAQMARTLNEIRRTGLRELERYLEHPAFRQRENAKWLQRAVAYLKVTHNPWAVAYFVLICRDRVQHYWDFMPVTPEPKAHPNGDRRMLVHNERDGVVRRHTVWKKVLDEYEDYHESEVIDTVTDRVSRGGFDLQGWDRPSSFPTKTTRMAFCQTCADKKASPWFRVPRKRTWQGYERAPYALTAKCPVCQSLESTPAPATSTRVFFHKQAVKRHGRVEHVIHAFYRVNGTWYWMKDHTQCHVALTRQLDHRWRKLKPLAIKK